MENTVPGLKTTFGRGRPVKYDFSDEALKTIGRLDANTAGRIVKGIMKLPAKGDIKALEGGHSGEFRLRVGDWRIIKPRMIQYA